MLTLMRTTTSGGVSSTSSSFYWYARMSYYAAQAVTYLCCAPKSNACYMGIEKAMQDVINVQIKSVPSHLKNCHYSGSKKRRRRIKLSISSRFLGHYVQQQYLPDELIDRIYYEPTENGVEKE